MGWSPESAARAYLDTVRLCKLHHERRHGAACLSTETEPQSTEFISALAAGMNAHLIVMVCSGAAPFSIALAAAARHTGGRLVCILPGGHRCSELLKALSELGLEDGVEFATGDARQLLPQYNNVDFALIDCTNRQDQRLVEVLKLNPGCAVVVANNLLDRNGSAFKRRVGAKCITLPVGKGIEVIRITGAEDKRTDMKMDNNGPKNKWSGRKKHRMDSCYRRTHGRRTRLQSPRAPGQIAIAYLVFQSAREWSSQSVNPVYMFLPSTPKSILSRRVGWQDASPTCQRLHGIAIRPMMAIM